MRKKITTLADLEEEYNKLLEINSNLRYELQNSFNLNEDLRKELKDTLKELRKSREDFNSFYRRYDDLEQKYKSLERKYEEVKIRADKFAPMQRQISDEQVKEIKKLRSEGKTYKEIRIATGWSNMTIARVLQGIYDL